MTEQELDRLLKNNSALSVHGVGKPVAHNLVSMPPQDRVKAVQSKFDASANIPLESWEQMQVVDWMHSRGHRVHHSPNGGKRSKAEAGRFAFSDAS